MSKGIVIDIIFFDYTIRGKCFLFQPFQGIVKSGREMVQTALSTCILYKSSIEPDIDLLVIVLPIVRFTLFKCKTDDMPANTEKSKVLHLILLRLALR